MTKNEANDLVFLFAFFTQVQVSCVGFMTRIPFREIATSRVINFTFDQTIVASDNCLSFACLFLFPTGTQYPAGTPVDASQ